MKTSSKRNEKLVYLVLFYFLAYLDFVISTSFLAVSQLPPKIFQSFSVALFYCSLYFIIIIKI